MAGSLEKQIETMKETAAKRKAALEKKASADAPAGELRRARKLLKRAQRGARKLDALQARLAAAAKKKSGEGES